LEQEFGKAESAGFGGGSDLKNRQLTFECQLKTEKYRRISAGARVKCGFPVFPFEHQKKIEFVKRFNYPNRLAMLRLLGERVNDFLR